jgi:hypothetical protein
MTMRKANKMMADFIFDDSWGLTENMRKFVNNNSWHIYLIEGEL